METVVKSTQEQAVASWISYLNQIRFEELIDRLNEQDINLRDALGELQKLKVFIGDPNSILGSALTKHGEIAENAQVYISNARKAIDGLPKEYSFEGVGRTAPEDYTRNGLPVQSKFLNGLSRTLNGNGNSAGILQHFKKYPNFLNEGGSYDIPKDQYHEMIQLLEKRSNTPTLLTKEEIRLLNSIDSFEKNSGLSVRKDIHPSVVKYSEVQQGKINDTVSKEEASIRKHDQDIRDVAHEHSKPSLNEGAKTTVISAALEGSIGFCLAVAKKRKEGKNLSEFTSADWSEIGIDTGKSTAKGAVRGASVYALSNFTTTPANVASALVTAIFGVTAQANALRKGLISKEDFIINSETVCLDVTISAVASLLGQTFIPVPVLGAIIGNTAGMFMYELAKTVGLEKEQSLISDYQAEMKALQVDLDKQYEELLMLLETRMKKFRNLVELAFDPDVNKAFWGSVELAYFTGVPDNKILKAKKDIDAFFLN